MDKCEKRIFDGWHSQHCSRNAWKDGYCKQHYLDTVAARKKRSAEAYEAKSKREPWYLLRQAEKRIVELEAEVAEWRRKHG